MPDYDVIVIGSGAGGGTAARALGEAGKKVLLLERGGYIPREPQNWDAAEVFDRGRYVSPDQWLDRHGKPFAPQAHYNVGGATKFYGAALLRMTQADFGEVKHYGGVSPQWPLTYAQLERWYDEAERMYHVHAVDHEPVIEALSRRLAAAGLYPFHAPTAVMESECVRCPTCDGFPCRIHAKADAETCGVAPALATGNVTLETGVTVTRIVQAVYSGHEQVAGVETADGNLYRAPVVVLAAGAVNSAALWLRSGLPDRSRQVGRNYMCHESQAVLAVGEHKNPPGFHKTLQLMNWYTGDITPDGYPLGSVQMAGQPQPAMLRGESGLARLLPGVALREIAARSVVFWLMSEDLPSAGNRVTVSRDGKIQLAYRANNPVAARGLYRQVARLLPSLGYPVHLRKPMPLGAVAHQCGTLRMSTVPQLGPVSLSGEAHEVHGLYVADASVFPSASAVNPALTVIANALRVADAIAHASRLA